MQHEVSILWIPGYPAEPVPATPARPAMAPTIANLPALSRAS